jgi:hypothetical protein
MELLKDPNLLMDAKLQSGVTDQALHALQNGLGTGILQVFSVAVISRPKSCLASGGILDKIPEK